MICCKGLIDSVEMHLGEMAWSFAWRQALPVCSALCAWRGEIRSTASLDPQSTLMCHFSLKICGQLFSFDSWTVFTWFLITCLKRNPPTLVSPGTDWIWSLGLFSNMSLCVARLPFLPSFLNHVKVNETWVYHHYFLICKIAAWQKAQKQTKRHHYKF